MPCFFFWDNKIESQQIRSGNERVSHVGNLIEMLGTCSCCQCCATKLGNITFHTHIKMLFDYACNLDLYIHLYLDKRGAAALKASLQHVRTIQKSMTAICWSNTKANSAAFSTSGMSAIEILGHVYSQIHMCAKQILHVKKQVIPLLLIKTKNTVCF